MRASYKQLTLTYSTKLSKTSLPLAGLPPRLLAPPPRVYTHLSHVDDLLKDGAGNVQLSWNTSQVCFEYSLLGGVLLEKQLSFPMLAW